MNTENERIFCTQFINGKRQERMFYELSHPKKRVCALSRFCHNAESVLKAGCLVERSCSSDVNELRKMIRGVFSSVRGYVMSWDEMDGTEQWLADALQSGIASGMGFAILVDAYTAFVREEQEQGAPEAFLLYVK